MPRARQFGPYEALRAINADRSVFEAVDTRDGSLCVVKIARRGTFNQMDLPMPLEERGAILAEEAAILRAVDDCSTMVRVLAWEPRHRPPYLILERLEATLDAHIPDDGMEPIAAIAVLRDIGSALVALNAIHRCHNDVKPANVLRDDGRDCWKLIDPAPMLIDSHYYPNRSRVGPARDLVALARLFLTALFGAEQEGLDEAALDYFEGEHLLQGLAKPIQRALRGEGSAAALSRRAKGLYASWRRSNSGRRSDLS